MLAHNLLGVTMKPLPPISKAFNKRLNEAAKAGEREAIEREHIVAMLRKTRGVVEGPNGAAQLLDMNPSTVRFRMKKLGISKVDYLIDTSTRPGTSP